MVKILILILNILIIANKLNANEPRYYFSPGVKIAYQLGDNTGVVFGFDSSIMRTLNNLPNYGVVTSIDFCNGNTKIHFGAQVAHILGIDIGPTIYITKKSTNFGFSTAIYGLLYFIPFFEYTKIFGDEDFSLIQNGLFLKYPIPTDEIKVRIDP